MRYATEYDETMTARPGPEAREGDRVRQIAYGAGYGRLSDVARVGTVVKVNRTRALVRFDHYNGETLPVHGDVLRLLSRAAG